MALLRFGTKCCCRQSRNGVLNALRLPLGAPVYSRIVPCSSNASSERLKEPMIPFEEYVKARNNLKNTRRVFGGVCSIVGTYASSFALLYYVPAFTNMWDVPPDQVVPVFGVDPLAAFMATVIFSSISFFAVGNMLYGAVHGVLFRSSSEKIKQRDKDFHARILRHRFSKDSGFEDDFYGEKIKSVSDYRQWVRMQQKKRTDYAASQKGTDLS